MDQKTEFGLVTIGRVAKNGDAREIRLKDEYRAGLGELEGFSHVMVIWWADRYAEHRFAVDMVIEAPYAPGVKTGLFATRSPVRPNPLGVNVAGILDVDTAEGVVRVDEIDAFDGTPVVDIKPYYGCIDRVKDYRQPDWVPGDWSEWYEPLGEIDYS